MGKDRILTLSHITVKPSTNKDHGIGLVWSEKGVDQVY